MTVPWVWMGLCEAVSRGARRAPAPYLLISSVCTPYLLSILYLPGSPAWQIKLPFLYLHEGNTPVTAKTACHAQTAFLRGSYGPALGDPPPRTSGPCTAAQRGG